VRVRVRAACVLVLLDQVKKILGHRGARPGAQLLCDQLVSFGVKRGAGLLGLHRGDELVLRRADGGLRGVGAALEQARS
jgi:hypothetical protein